MMAALSLLHRWAGAFVGFLLALLGLTGAILVWEGEWISLPHASDPVVENAARIGAVVESAGPSLSRITFASEEIGLHQLVFRDGSGAYVSQDGLVVDRWQSQWERPELWLFDLHHYLFVGETGELITGVAGIAGVIFVITGLILWLRGPRALRLRLWPKRFKPGPIVAHHRDLGVIVAPLLLLSLITGVFMLFVPLKDALLGVEERPKQETVLLAGPTPAQSIGLAKARFPDAALRRIVVPAKAGYPVVVRMRQPFEWTPNGRTQLSFTGDGGVTIEDAASANLSATISEKFYPLHSAKVGGLVWKLMMTVSGLSLAMLGSLAMWSFWARRSGRKTHRKRAGLKASIA